VQRTYNRYKENGLMVIGLGFHDAKGALMKFAMDMKMDDTPLVFDTASHAAAKYGISYGAGAVFINRNGIVTKRFIAGFNEKEFLEEVDKIVR